MIILFYIFMEFWVTFIIIGTYGFGATMLEFILSFVAGTMLLRMQLRKLSRGESSGDTLLYFISGLMLMVPGIISDVLALSILLYPTRLVWRRWMKNNLKFQSMMNNGMGGFQFFSYQVRSSPPPAKPHVPSERDVTPLVIETKGTRL